MAKTPRVVVALVLLCALMALPASARPLASAPEISVWEKISAPFLSLWNVLAGPITSTKEEDSDARGGIDPWGGAESSEALTDCRGGIDPWGACSSGE